MATISTATYLDQGTARTAGEAWTINSGGSLTIRTDTRWHADAPASMTGSLGSQTINEGQIIYDARNVRWIAITGGSGTSAIGTTVTQGAVSGYFLGYWSSLTAAPSTTVGATGFIKFREVTGGTFTAGTLTFSAGTGAATAAGADVAGWIEIVGDAASTITVPRLGKHTTRGSWFYLANTNGTVGQVIDTPTNGGGAGTRVPGVWIEKNTATAATYTWANSTITVSLTAHGYKIGEDIDIEFTGGSGTPNGTYTIASVPTTGTFTFSLAGSGTGGNCNISCYEFWPALYGSTNGWAYTHIGGAYGATDARQNFVKDIDSGQFQIGEASDLSATYANIAAQDSTYASIAHASTYTWASDIVTITYNTGHLLKTGQQVHCDFTSGGATANDGTYTITVLNAYTYTVPLVGSGSSGNVTVRPGHTITFTAHTLGVGDTVYCDFTTGAGVNGSYTIYGVTGANTYLIQAPHAATTSGNVSVYSRYQISYTAHGLAVGNRVYLDFTSGAGIDGIYTIIAVAANTFDIVANNGASADSGNVTVKQTIGNIPPTGRKIRIPNIILRECAVASRASNQVNATIANRPEWATTTAGALDFEYIYSTWYHNLNQTYQVIQKHFTLLDTLVITESATSLELDDGGIGMNVSGDLRAIQLTSNFAGGNISNIKAQRGNTPNTTDHAVEVLYCKDQTFTNVQAGIIRFARSSGKAIQVNYCSNLTFTGCQILNSDLNITASADINISNIDFCDRYIGYSNLTTPYYSVNVNTKSSNVAVDGLTYGLNGTIANTHSFYSPFYAAASTNITFKNAGSFSAPLDGGSAWRPNLYAPSYAYISGGNNNTIKVKRVYLSTIRTGSISTINSDKNVVYESVQTDIYALATHVIYAQINAGLNSIYKGSKTGQNTTTGQSSVYGTHFMDLFLGDTTGRLILAMNEPTTETSSQFTMVSGTAKFNSAGGILMDAVGTQAIWEDSCFRLGHTGFVNSTPTMSGGTIGNYTIEYDIDIGSGYSNSWTTASGANLSAITVDPAIGFKMKIRITTTILNATAITYLRIDTISTASAQQNNLYPIDISAITLTNMVNSSRYEIYNIDTATILATGTSPSNSKTIPFTVNVVATNDDNLRIRVRESSSVSAKYLPFETETLVSDLSANVFISQILDSIIS